jgi:hypothetical protein
MLYCTHSHGRAEPNVIEKETREAVMATSEFFWKLFKDTGSISAYLIYRQLHPAPAPAT